MSMNAYKVEGDFEMGRIRQHFGVEVVGANEDAAREAVYADLGSRHSVARRQIKIESVAKLDADAASPITQKKLE